MTVTDIAREVPATIPVSSVSPNREKVEETTSVVTFSKALNLALHDSLKDDPTVVLMGEDIGKLGGVFRVTDGLQREFGTDRVIDSPLAESGIIGTAIGMALAGYRPVCEIQFDGFVYPGYDQIITQLSKLRERTGGQVAMPVVIRIPYGGGIGSVEHHSGSPEAQFAHTPGLRILAPSNPHDAYWMLRQAIELDDPVIFFEPKRRYWLKGGLTTQTPVGHVATPERLSPFQAQVLRTGTDATLVTYGPLVPTALAAADIAAQEGKSLEVIDVRSIAPLDTATIIESVQHTGRLIVAHEAPTRGGVGGEIAAEVGEAAFAHLKAPITRVGGWNVHYPPAKLEEHYLPNLDRILDAVDRTINY